MLSTNRERRPVDTALIRPPREMHMIDRTLKTAMAFGLCLAYAASSPAQEVERKMNRDTGRRIIVNWDGGSIELGLFNHRPKVSAELTKRMIEEMVDEHAGAGVDVYSHVVFAQFKTTLPSSEVVQVIPQYTRALAETGMDYFQIQLDRCRHHGIEMLACLRMNDRHGNSVHAQFYKDHPEWRIPEKSGGLDYKHEGVRKTVLAFIEEVLAKYDVDGIEFDYMRWCHVFRPAEAVENAHFLTDFTRKARALLEEAAGARGREGLLLGVRVPQTLEECAALGFDVETWIKEGLVDYVVPSDFFYTDFNTKVEDYVKLTEGADCKIYPAIHPILCQQNDNRLMTLANYRAAAHNFYARGAAGISPFNYMYSWDKRRNPAYIGSGLMWPAALGYLRELRDPEKVGKRDRHYLFYALWRHPSQSGFRHDERIVLDRAKPDAKGTTRLRLCEDLSDPKLRATLQFKATGMREDETLEIALNDRLVPEESVTRVFHGDGQTKYEGRELPAFFLHVIDFPRGEANPFIVNGDNELTVRLKSENDPAEGAISIDELELYVYVTP